MLSTAASGRSQEGILTAERPCCGEHGLKFRGRIRYTYPRREEKGENEEHQRPSRQRAPNLPLQMQRL